MPSVENDIIQCSAIETRTAIAAGQISVQEVVEAHLQRIRQVNPAINAVVELLDEEARTRAQQLDKQKDKSALLFGIPVTTKINIAQKGCATSNGVAAYNTPQHIGDSPVVINLKDSGAILLGRSNTPEFSLRFFTSNPIYGATRNPRNPAITPGGSSGAAAAAVACGVGAIAHGNDLGGSLRYPAYCCGVATIRPSLGCIPSYNPGAMERPPITQLMSVQGPIARSIADVRLGLEAMRKRSPLDPLWVEASRPIPDTLKIGYHPQPFSGAMAAEVSQALEDAAVYLQDAGATLVEMKPPHAEECAAVWGKLLFTELRHTMLHEIEQHGSDDLLRTLHISSTYFEESPSFQDFFQTLQKRIQLQRAWLQMFEDVDLLLMPVSLALPFADNQDFKQPETIPAILEAQKPLWLANLLGLPAVQVPVHITGDGVPVGVQLVGARHSDFTCLKVAEWIEQRNGLSTRPLSPPPATT